MQSAEVSTSQDNNHKLPILFKKDSKGNLQYWKISVAPNPEAGYDICTKYGKVDGKVQMSTDTITKGKNVGRSNETAPEEQAVAEAKSRWTKQIERKGYVENPDDVDKDLRPGAEAMLAHRYDKYPDKIEFPCFIQPKLDGHRCIAIFEDGNVQLFSRQRKQITGLPHVEAAIATLFAGKQGKVILDGELYNHDYKNNFEELTSHIRNEKPKDGHEIVQYHLYDVVDHNQPFSERFKLLLVLADQIKSEAPIKLVRTDMCTQNLVVDRFKMFRQQGYEGAILRNFNGMYVGKRSYDLQKVKEFCDDEFKIVGVEEGRGKMKGHAIFVCHTHEGKEFKAKMKGSMESLAEYFQNKEKYIGKSITVQFQEYTKDGIPRFPVALRFREDV